MNRDAKPFFILCVAVAIVFVLSFFTWEKLSGGRFKSFDMLADVRPGGSNVETIHAGNEYLDPDLAMLDNDEPDYERYEYIPDDDEPAAEDESLDEIEEDGDWLENREEDNESETDADAGSAVKDAESEATAEPENNGKQPEPDNKATSKPAVADNKQGAVNARQGGKTGEKPQQPSKPEQKPATAEQPKAVPPHPQAGLIFEDYSQGASNTKKLKNMLSKAASSTRRIAVIGDSYIEGDIFTEGVRDLLQDRYGGSGIGYTPLFSEIPGFRRSVVHSCSGFENIDFRQRSSRPYCLLHGVASKAEEGAAATFSGTSKAAHGERWNKSLILLKAPSGGSLKVKVGKGADAVWQTFTYPASNELQAISLDGATSRISLGSITPGIVFQGAYLDGNEGIAVDNMSIRGYAGIRHNEIDAGLARESRQYIDYDLIVLEFGINALSSNQHNYDAYARQMTRVVQHIKELYPNAVVMIMGIGDRGEKQAGEVHSMATAADMVAAQRKIARDSGSLFWDTRQAMGGDDAVVQWVKDKEVNKDYIHLSFAGGRHLAELFVDALQRTVK